MLSIIPPIIAHRGVSALAPENTIPAFQKVHECGLSWAEFDVTLTKCGEVVVFHDDELMRTTNGIGMINDCSYAYLKSLDAGSWFHPVFHQAKIPTLREVLLLLGQYNIGLNVEIKSYPGHEKALVTRVFEEINHYAGREQPLLISSFSSAILEEVRHISQTVQLGFLMHAWQNDWRQQCDRFDAQSVNVNHNILSEENIKAIKSTGRTLLAYTVNDVARAKQLFSFGVDAVFSDCPHDMLAGFNLFA